MAIKCGRGYGAFQQPRGANLASDRVQRRLTAILAADVAGYSRLMGLDEAGTARTLHEHRAAVDPIVASFGGRIVKTTGDGVLLEFPSIVAAVDCAVVVQNLMTQRNGYESRWLRLLFRIGINMVEVTIYGCDILRGDVYIAAWRGHHRETGGTSRFDYKVRAVDVKQVSRVLGVRYLLEGSVRKSGNRVRITGQLIDATTGKYLWADRFDGPLENIFELQDQVASGVVGALDPK